MFYDFSKNEIESLKSEITIGVVIRSKIKYTKRTLLIKLKKLKFIARVGAGMGRILMSLMRNQRE